MKGTTSRYNRAFGTAAAAALCLVGLGACGSSSGSTAGNTVATTVPVTTTVPNTGSASGASSSLASQADAVCAEVKSVSTTLGHMNLSTPQSAKNAVGTITNDLSQMQNALNQASAAGQQGARSGPLQTMFNDVRQAVKSGQGALSQLAQGNAGNAQTGYHQVISDLQNARQAGKSANVSSCS